MNINLACSRSSETLPPVFLNSQFYFSFSFLPQIRPCPKSLEIPLPFASLFSLLAHLCVSYRLLHIPSHGFRSGLHSPTAIMITSSFNSVEITLAIFRASGLVMPNLFKSALPTLSRPRLHHTFPPAPTLHRAAALCCAQLAV